MSSELGSKKLAQASVALEPSAPAAVRISNVSKCYQIYDRPQDRLKQAIMPRLNRLIRADDRLYFREFWALRDVSFSVSKGETIGILGRNGSGKSTLLQTLCGTLSPTSGEVEINGRVGALLELGSGFNPEFSGRENVYLSGAVLGLSKEQVDERFDQIVEFSEIGDFLDQPVKQYSSGMYVRLAFSVIAHADADILVIDEALSVGDIFFAQKCMRFLRDFMQRGTVIFVSHDTSAVLNLCDRAIWLNRGQVVADGPSKQVVSRYLEDLYYESQSVAENDLVSKAAPPERAAAGERDVRQDLINASQLRNEIEVFDFSALSRSFGTGKAQIIGASFFNAEGEPTTWLTGGDPVRLSIKGRVLEDIDQPIVGFEVYDRLGQVIFADNTFLTTLGKLMVARAGQEIETNFEFSMPIMREGDYTISLAIASGTQDNHVQHQWLHEALAFHVHTRTICLGLVAVPMRSIELKIGA